MKNKLLFLCSLLAVGAVANIANDTKTTNDEEYCLDNNGEQKQLL